MPEVKPEISGWRDLALSKRHRKWGFNCPATDIDLIIDDFIEYDRRQARGIVEFKNIKCQTPTLNDANNSALEDLADRAKIPSFLVIYSPDFSKWIVCPNNSIGRKYTGEASMTEKGFVSLLYRIRGRNVPDGLFDEYGNLNKNFKG